MLQWIIEILGKLNTTDIIIITGSILGSIKANFNDKETKLSCNRVINIILGMFCGVLVSFHFENNNLPWLSGIVSITVSMLSVAILDTLYIATPTITKLLIRLRLGIKDDL